MFIFWKRPAFSAGSWVMLALDSEGVLFLAHRYMGLPLPITLSVVMWTPQMSEPKSTNCGRALLLGNDQRTPLSWRIQLDRMPALWSDTHPAPAVMILSRPVKVPKATNIMFVVSIWTFLTNSCSRSVRLTTLPSSILSMLCWTPSPCHQRCLTGSWFENLGRFEAELGIFSRPKSGPWRMRQRNCRLEADRKFQSMFPVVSRATS